MPDRPQVPKGVLGVNRRPSRREWRGAFILFGVGVIGLVLALRFIHPQAVLLPLGATPPAVTLPDVSGQSVSVAATAAGRPYVVEFFETSCSHCQQAAAQLCGQRVPVFAIDAGADSVSAITDYRRQYAPACNYPLLVDPKLSAAKSYAVSAVPTVYVVSSGKIVYAGAGLDAVAGLRAAIDKALGG